MQTFTSKIETILHPQECIYKTLSDLNNLSLIENRLPKDKIKELSFDTDSVSAKVDVVGNITLRIIDRDPYKTIKLTVEGAPSDANLWIQFKEVSPKDTKIKITLKAPLNGMMKMMLKGKIKGFLDNFAEGLTRLDYTSLNR